MNVTDAEKIIISRLKAERERQKLSQLEVAYRSGVSQNMIAYIEKGKRTPTISTMLKICYALEMNPSDLFKEDHSKEDIKNQIITLLNRL